MWSLIVLTKRNNSICSTKYWEISFSLITDFICNGLIFCSFLLQFRFYFLVLHFSLCTFHHLLLSLWHKDSNTIFLLCIALVCSSYLVIRFMPFHMKWFPNLSFPLPLHSLKLIIPAFPPWIEGVKELLVLPFSAKAD